MTISLQNGLNEENDFEFNDANLQKHDVSRMEVMQVIESNESEYFPLSRHNNNDRLMFVGFSQISVRLLEVGVEFLLGDKVRIFHANKARQYFVNLYNKRKRI